MMMMMMMSVLLLKSVSSDNNNNYGRVLYGYSTSATQVPSGTFSSIPSDGTTFHPSDGTTFHQSDGTTFHPSDGTTFHPSDGTTFHSSSLSLKTTDNDSASCASNESAFRLELLLDWFEETSWVMNKVSDGSIVGEGSQDKYKKNTEYVESLCLTNGDDYSFTIYDEYGDGLTYNGEAEGVGTVGHYYGFLNNQEIFRGFDFKFEETKKFTVADAADAAAAAAADPLNYEDEDNDDVLVLWSLQEPYYELEGQTALNLVGNDVESSGLTEIFQNNNIDNNNQVLLRTKNGSWIRNIYLPYPNNMKIGSKFQIKCDSTYYVNIIYNNSNNHEQEQVLRVNKGEELLLIVLDSNDDDGTKVWYSEYDYTTSATQVPTGIFSSIPSDGTTFHQTDGTTFHQTDGTTFHQTDETTFTPFLYSVDWEPLTNTVCTSMQPICTSDNYEFVAESGSELLESETNNYDCLTTQPNPTWFYLKIDNSGDIVMSLLALRDIDYNVSSTPATRWSDWVESNIFAS